MKKAMTIVAASLMLAASCTARRGDAKPQGAADGAQAAKETKVLVAYFSCTGTTERAAKAVAEATGGRLYRIAPKEEYTAADLDWNDRASRSTAEMKDPASRPALADTAAGVDGCDIVFVGYPIWWDQCPRPVNTFLESYDFTGKTVVPFATSGGSSIANSVAELRKLYGQSITITDGKLLNGDTEEAKRWAAGQTK